jgi:hypothetical protein
MWVHPSEEIKSCRQLLSALEGDKKYMTLWSGNRDITGREIVLLKREIAYLEVVLSRVV